MSKDTTLRDQVFAAVEHVSKNEENKRVVCLLLLVLENVGKENNELRDLSFQHKNHIRDLKFCDSFYFLQSSRFLKTKL